MTVTGTQNTDTFMEQLLIRAKLAMCVSTNRSANLFFSCEAAIVQTEIITVITAPL